MANKKRTDNALIKLLASAGPEILRDLVSTLAFRDPEVRRECFEYLKAHAPLSTTQKQTSDGEVVLALWEELYPDLEEMDDCGGGDYHVVYHVGDLLGQIRERLADGNVSQEVRRELLGEILPFIKSGNAGLDDELYDTAYAACREEAEWRWLACSFEAMKQDWPLDHARRIYRRLGDREKYLELRRLKMVYGADYHDLAQFYQGEDNREQALAIAEEGLKKEYARKAKVMAKIRRVYLDILKSEERWRDFAGKFKRANLRRPALQEECARAMPGWGELS